MICKRRTAHGIFMDCQKTLHLHVVQGGSGNAVGFESRKKPKGFEIGFILTDDLMMKRKGYREVHRGLSCWKSKSSQLSVVPCMSGKRLPAIWHICDTKLIFHIQNCSRLQFPACLCLNREPTWCLQNIKLGLCFTKHNPLSPPPPPLPVSICLSVTPSHLLLAR